MVILQSLQGRVEMEMEQVSFDLILSYQGKRYALRQQHTAQKNTTSPRKSQMLYAYQNACYAMLDQAEAAEAAVASVCNQ